MASDDDFKPVVVTILGKEYRVACPPHERDDLLRSAAYVDEKMRELRNRGRTLGTENVAVMAALNIAHELIEERENEQADALEPAVTERLRRLNHKVESALADIRQMEI